MKYVKALGLGAAGALLCSSAAMAQALDWNTTVRARVTYDSAAARSSDAIAAARGLEEEDVIGDILATFNVKRPVGRQQLFAQGSVGYDFHQQNTQLNRERINVTAGVSRQVGPCAAKGSGGYARSQSDLEDLNLEAVKNVLERRSVQVGLACSRVIGIAPTFSFSQDWVENSAATRQQANSDSITGRIGLGYSRPVLGSVSVYGEYRESTFPNRLILVNGELIQDGFEVYSGGVQYDRALGSRLAGSISAAYTSLRPEAPGVNGYDGLTYGASLSYRPTSRLSTNLAFTRDTRPSNRLDSTYDLHELLSLQANYKIGYRLSLSLGGSRSTNKVQGAALVPGIDVRDEETRAIFGAVSMKVNEHVALSLDARHQERDADLSGFDYRSEQIGLTATAGF